MCSQPRGSVAEEASYEAQHWEHGSDHSRIAGVILLIVGLFVPMSLALEIILVVVGAALVITAAIRFCPIYAVLKFNTLNK